MTSRLPVLLTLLLWLAGCTVLSPPIRPTIAPLPPLSENVVAPEQGSADITFVGNTIQPLRDPDIVALMNNVSQQQLIAYVQTLGDFGTRNSFSATQRPDFGIGATRNWIFSEFERVGGGRLQVQFQDFPLTYAGFSAPQRNVVATLPGNGRYPGAIVLCAHYDTRVGSPTDGASLSPSANDNAAGVAMLLEVARLLSSRTWNHTIIFVAFAAEEQETAGSRHFVSNVLLTGRQIDFAINNDGIGGRPGIPQFVRLFAPQQENSESGRAARTIDYLGQLYLPEFPVQSINAMDRQDRYGDQREFQRAGIGAVRLIESQENPAILNSPTDTWEKLDYNYLMQITRLNLVVAANWAGAPQPAQRPAAVGLAEPGQWLLTWPTDPLAAGYAVGIRPISQTGFSEVRYLAGNEAGSLALTLNPQEQVVVSVAPIGVSGRLGGFSPELLIP
jgi:hypothetical protein